jgi:hypothetical protein
VLAGRVRGCSPIPSVRLGRRMLIRRGSLLAWIEQNETRYDSEVFIVSGARKG